MAERRWGRFRMRSFSQQLMRKPIRLRVLVKHIAGNQKSRWTDFLTRTARKRIRNRDTEFELMDDSRESLMEFWEAGWQTLFDCD